MENKENLEKEVVISKMENIFEQVSAIKAEEKIAEKYKVYTNKNN